MCYRKYKYPITKKIKSLKITFKCSQLSSDNQVNYIVFTNYTLKLHAENRYLL